MCSQFKLYNRAIFKLNIFINPNLNPTNNIANQHVGFEIIDPMCSNAVSILHASV